MSGNRPHRDELLAVVRESLLELAAQSQPASAFELRVAAKAVAIVQRELALGAQAGHVEQQHLQELLARTGELDELRCELCRQLRTGQLRHDDPRLLSALRAGIEAWLAIDNPDFTAAT